MMLTMLLPLEKQVCSLESAKRLKELGFVQESLFYWWEGRKKPDIYSYKDIGFFNSTQIYSAYSVAELGELLPKGEWVSRIIGGIGGQWQCYKNDSFKPEWETQVGDTEAEARAKMLIYLKEKKLI